MKGALKPAGSFATRESRGIGDVTRTKSGSGAHITKDVGSASAHIDLSGRVIYSRKLFPVFPRLSSLVMFFFSIFYVFLCRVLRIGEEKRFSSYFLVVHLIKRSKVRQQRMYKKKRRDLKARYVSRKQNVIEHISRLFK